MPLEFKILDAGGFEYQSFKMNTMRTGFLWILFMLPTLTFSQKQDFETIEKEFLNAFEAMDIPDLQINYVNLLQDISEGKELTRQDIFFRGMLEKIKNIDSSKLTDHQWINYEIINYEAHLNLERIRLEQDWKEVDLDDTKSIYTIPNGKNWYSYLLKRWVDAEVKPKELFSFGLEEIAMVKSNMTRLQEASGLSKEEFQEYLRDRAFYFENSEDIQKAFEKIKEEVGIRSKNLFPYVPEIPEVDIARSSNQDMAQVPAYYSNNTFFYNIFDKPFNKRQLGWFYVHEAIPGHHYQSNVNNIIERTRIQGLFWYPGYVEGWGAYVEYLGNELGIFKTIYDEYGKWEWDLIRSVRVCLDVALNYYGWSDDKALAFWKEHIKDQDDIGVREINRMKRWPAQVITYKYGAKVFLGLLQDAKSNADFDFKTFHHKVLEHGDIPISIVKKMMKKK